MFYLKTFISRILDIGEVQRQSIISLIWKIVFTVIGFLSTMYFAHIIGAGVLGAYFLFIAYFNIINLVTDGGMGSAAIKRISEGEERDAYFSAFVVLRSAFLIAVLTVLIAFRRYFVDLDNSGMFVWLLVTLVVSLFQGAVSNGNAGCGKIGIYATSDMIDKISRILLQVVAVFLGYGLAGLAGGFVVGVVVGSIVQLHFFDLRLARFGWRHIRSLSSFSFWSFLISSGMLVYLSADTLMIGYFLNNSDVGVYQVIVQFTTVATFTATAFRDTLFPKVSRWDRIGEIGLIEKSLSKAFTYTFIIALPLFVGGILLGDKLLYFFYGPDFVDYTTLMILFFIQIVNIFHYFFSTYLIAMGQLKELFKITVAAVAANIVLNSILIPVMGIMGAAVATLATMSLNAVLAQRVLSSRISIHVEHGSLHNILKASAVMGLIVGMYRLIVPLSSVWMTLVPVAVGGSVYFILILKYDRKIYDELKGIMTQMNVA